MLAATSSSSRRRAIADSLWQHDGLNGEQYEGGFFGGCLSSQRASIVLRRLPNHVRCKSRASRKARSLPEISQSEGVVSRSRARSANVPTPRPRASTRPRHLRLQRRQLASRRAQCSGLGVAQRLGLRATLPLQLALAPGRLQMAHAVSPSGEPRVVSGARSQRRVVGWRCNSWAGRVTRGRCTSWQWRFAST